MKKINFLIKLMVLVLLPLFCLQVKADYGLSLPQKTTQIVSLIKKEYPDLKVEIDANSISASFGGSKMFSITTMQGKAIFVVSRLWNININDKFYKELYDVNSKYNLNPRFMYNEDRKCLVAMSVYYGEYSDEKFGVFLGKHISGFFDVADKKFLDNYIIQK